MLRVNTRPTGLRAVWARGTRQGNALEGTGMNLLWSTIQPTALPTETEDEGNEMKEEQ